MYRRLFTEDGMLPLLVALIMLISSTSLLLGYFLISVKQKYYLQHNCRITALQSMQQVADGVNQLIEINPQALRLQVKLKRAQFLLKTATTPPQVTAALLYLQKVKLEQMLLHKKQLTIIARTERMANLSISRKVNGNSIKNYNRISIKLIPMPPHSDSPTYISYPGYENRQAVHIQWSKKISVNNKELKNRGNCSATVSKEKKWYPILAKDKAS